MAVRAPRKRGRLKAPKPIGELLGGSPFRRDSGNLVVLYRLQRGWAGLVGDDLARRTLPKTVRGKTLVVAVENGAWAQHLSLMKDPLLAALNARPTAAFTDVRFVCEALPAVPSGEPGRRPAPDPLGEVPPEPGIRDPELAEILGRVRARLNARRSA
jgi:predicted nucleic acid-binding Zn ribbon protein